MEFMNERRGPVAKGHNILFAIYFCDGDILTKVLLDTFLHVGESIRCAISSKKKFPHFLCEFRYHCLFLVIGFEVLCDFYERIIPCVISRSTILRSLAWHCKELVWNPLPSSEVYATYIVIDCVSGMQVLDESTRAFIVSDHASLHLTQL